MTESWIILVEIIITPRIAYILDRLNFSHRWIWHLRRFSMRHKRRSTPHIKKARERKQKIVEKDLSLLKKCLASVFLLFATLSSRSHISIVPAYDKFLSLFPPPRCAVCLSCEKRKEKWNSWLIYETRTSKIRLNKIQNLICFTNGARIVLKETNSKIIQFFRCRADDEMKLEERSCPNSRQQRTENMLGTERK